MRKTIVSLLLLLAGILTLAYGCYTAFFERNGYEETSAVITKVEAFEVGMTDNNEPEYQYDVNVKYIVDGKEYDGKLDYYEDGYEKGKEIRIFYDPTDPEKIHGDSKPFGVYLIIIGTILIIVSGLTVLRRR